MVALDVVQDSSCRRLQAWALAVLAAAGVETRLHAEDFHLVFGACSGAYSGSFRVSVARTAVPSRLPTVSLSGMSAGGRRWSSSTKVDGWMVTHTHPKRGLPAWLA